MTRRAAEWIERFRTDWMEQVPLEVMAAMRNLSKRNIVKTAQRMGLPRRPRRHKLDDGMVQVMERGLSHGKSLRYYGRLFQVSPHTIKRALVPRPRMRRCPICQGMELLTMPHQHGNVESPGV